jgi:uncharacterized protein (TIGR01244 family)
MNSESQRGLKLSQLSSDVFATGQITAGDLRAIVEYGFRSIVNNRPDDEVEEQPKSDDLAATAAALGMDFVHIPVVSRSITEKDVSEFRHACDNLERPILLFCRSGARSTKLWILSGCE